MRSDAGRWTRFGTVRAKLTLLATGLVAVVLLLSAFALVQVQQRLLERGIDESLIQRADNIEGDVARGTLASRLPAEGDPEDVFTQVVGADGQVLAASNDAAGLRVVENPLAPGADDALRSVSGIRGPDDDYRLLLRQVDAAQEPVTLVVAKNLDDVHESVRILAWSLAISLPVATLLLSLLVWWLTGRVLRPVAAIQAEVAGISGAELHRRVPVPPTHDEIARLAETMNDMLRRVEEAGQQQQRFVADASHELRGPLTRLRSTLEVAMAHPGAVDRESLLHSLLTEIEGLAQLVDDLLFLARSEAGALGPVTGVVDLDDLVLAEARRLRERGQREVSVSRVSAARTRGDGRQLARAIRNLAGNAERHAISAVSFDLREDGEVCELVVADDGAGIAPADRAGVFERFTRLDEARSRDAGGFGLGLAIVHDIVTRHGGNIRIDGEDGCGARFVLQLPRAE